jgi:hypothetical protein
LFPVQYGRVYESPIILAESCNDVTAEYTVLFCAF